MPKLLLTILVSKWVLLNALPTSLELNDSCTTPGGNHGRCIPVSSCQFVKDALDIVHGIEDQRYVEQFSCGLVAGSRKHLVCCPELSVDGCGQLHLEDHIVGGSETDPDEFPWTALLMFESRGVIRPRCGGALINDRYVLTAAHCVVNMRTWQLHSVRLGEWDLNSNHDCKSETNGQRCNASPHLDIPYEKIITHEGYFSGVRNKIHDIALVKLAKPAPTTDSIAPICLPTSEIDEQMVVDGQLFDVSGWGATGVNDPRSRRKLKVSLPGQNMAICQSAYAPANVTFTDNQLCVGGEEGKDSCRGDSGGPLMTVVNNRWHLAGIVSLGPMKCGMKGVPGIYTRMGKYLKWVVVMMEQP